jgi:KDO2-lipid IV(A) lauroyltransferase
MGAGLWHLAIKERRRALRQLASALGPEGEGRRGKRICRAMFRHLGESLAEFLSLPNAGPGKLSAMVEAPDLEKKAGELKKRGRGILWVTGHAGNWELLGAYLALRTGPLQVIAREIPYHGLNRLLTETRAALGVQTIYQSASPRAVLEGLRSGTSLGVLPDQDVRKLQGIHVPFFGKPAYTPTGPAALARAAGIPMVPLFICREGEKHRIRVGEPIEVDPRLPKPEAFARALSAWSGELERQIRRRPEQWVWFHRRWRTPQ